MLYYILIKTQIITNYIKARASFCIALQIVNEYRHLHNLEYLTKSILIISIQCTSIVTILLMKSK
jgi:hypothetical protein